MNTFDDIYGYEKEKRELEQICDMAIDPEKYARMGARMPRGVLLHGEPGVGKTLMVMAVAERTGRKCFVCRRDSESNNFLKEIYAVFEKAKKAAPSVIVLDDMDKFAMTERGESNSDRKEYVAVQSGIDGLKDADVLVLATANSMDAFPQSLLRPGRFDRIMRIRAPRIDESRCIISRYLEDKKIASDIDSEKLAWILEGHSAAVLEGVLNRAAIYAGYRNSEEIDMDDFVDACMHVAFNTDACDDDDDADDEDDYDCDDKKSGAVGSPEYIATHEAGHAIATEVLKPGTIRFVTTRKSSGERSGGKLVCKRNAISDDESCKQILVNLAGMAATELRYGIVDRGSCSDIGHACNCAAKLITYDCVDGVKYYRHNYPYNTDAQDDAIIDAIQTKMEKAYAEAKDILRANWGALCALSDRLEKKDVIFGDEIEDICGF